MKPLLTIALSLILLVSVSACQSDEGPRAMGTVERDQIRLSATASEQITSVDVHEGQVVHKGDRLLQLDTRQADALVRQRQAELAQANAALNKLIAGTRPEQLNAAFATLQSAQAASREAELTYQRNAKLYKTKVIGKAALDSAKANRDRTTAETKKAYDQWLELKNGARKEDISQAQDQVKAAQAALVWQERARDKLTITAPSNGVIDTLPWHTGDYVIAGTQLVNLIKTGHPYARIYLPATVRTQIHVGDRIAVFADGIDKPIQGVVRNIRSQPAYTPFYALNERDRARLMYLTDIDLEHAKALPTGLGVEVHLP
ncbi:HlyD family secretion protein [Marinomonas spartinae]|uniref:HlyD family secretion protein n=1 Tax=Marinomonas spartinae TaxID=1792290 RepID=UPI0018F1A8A7|nr:HlyD family efflux transporter periplasmic adaptor subunit [Marinomonas spartinae]MBJ7553863.1 HlyD family efflux transporter periplasmic adaptor subunit [Marinomonas spartinae]